MTLHITNPKQVVVPHVHLNDFSAVCRTLDIPVYVEAWLQDYMIAYVSESEAPHFTRWTE